jgi:hypothetical protein
VPAGYSKRPLAEKLGIRPDQRVAILNPPEGYERTLGPLPDGVQRAASARGPLHLIQFFTVDRKELEKRVPVLARALRDDGALWVSWPKGASGVRTDVNENVVRQVGLANGLVDVKVCAVDEVWSGLKLVIRRENRPRSG